ncbi:MULTISPECIES: ABC transporter permease [Clostridia]|uniref:ABC transporter permease n=1 Tax=Clostridia TaxID=186801 RepID=UPI00067ED74C|nr:MULTISPECIES: ABC transporter permease [Clostridia]
MFYPKLALTNLKKNGKTYIPYLLTCVLTVMMFYVMNAISRNTGLDQMQGADTLRLVLRWAVTITGIFSVVFLFYTNSFLVKQRKKEFGLYQVLGMDKGNLTKMMAWESILTTLISILLGLVLGVLLGKLMFLILLKMIHFEVPLKFAVEPAAMIGTIVLFLITFAITFIFNLFQVQKANPIELLHGGSQGEKEPKTKWLFALIGAVTLGIGYYIAQTTDSPLAAIGKFFTAVILVIIGTYCLFTAGSIAVLKILKKNKKFYYQSRHFTAVSGMIYRMKQNAVGLANICILSTIVLVMISVSVSLYAGMENLLATRFPTDMDVMVFDASQENRDKTDHIIEEETKKAGVKIEDRKSYSSGSFTVIYDEKNSTVLLEEKPDKSYTTEDFRWLEIIPLSDYNRLEGTNETLERDEVLIHMSGGEWKSDVLQIEDVSYKVKKAVSLKEEAENEVSGAVEGMVVVMSDIQQIADLKQQYGYEGADTIIYSDSFNMSGKEEDKNTAAKAIEQRLAKEVAESRIEYREAYRGEFYVMYGGFLFLGVFVGALFLMATVLIIYYKQISEGYDDRGRYQIMQKVGMSKKEVRRSIKTQVLMVFFLPLIAAIIHVAFAFKTVTKLLAVMNLTNVHLFFLCTVGTVLIFAVFYAAIFLITSKQYYRIVQ